MRGAWRPRGRKDLPMRTIAAILSGLILLATLSGCTLETADDEESTNQTEEEITSLVGTWVQPSPTAAWWSTSWHYLELKSDGDDKELSIHYWYPYYMDTWDQISCNTTNDNVCNTGIIHKRTGTWRRAPQNVLVLERSGKKYRYEFRFLGPKKNWIDFLALFEEEKL